MGCWKRFNSILKEANLTVSDRNEDNIEEVIHKYIGQKFSLGKCSADWKKTRAQIKENSKLKAELVAALKTSASYSKSLFLLMPTQLSAGICLS